MGKSVYRHPPALGAERSMSLLVG
ncbi:hypothetical protein MICRO80W_770008 [Micrococcus luteus]|nr:hypothetical protein MICRO80W_770008 [Micrococcus luteus]